MLQVIASRSLDCGVRSDDDVPGRISVHAGWENASDVDCVALDCCADPPSAMAVASDWRLVEQKPAYGSSVIVGNLECKDGGDGNSGSEGRCYNGQV